MGRRGPLFSEEDKNIGGKQRVDGVLEELVDTPAIGSQDKRFFLDGEGAILPARVVRA